MQRSIFYAAKYHSNESYVIVERKKVSFTMEEINELYGLLNDLDSYPSQSLIAEPTKGDARMIIQLIAWLGAGWTRTTTRSLQLYPHQLTTEANVWLFFIKKKIIPMRYDSTVPIEYMLLLYCKMAKQPFNLGYMMNEAFLGLMRNSKGTKP